jgi:hypothetical protein
VANSGAVCGEGWPVWEAVGRPRSQELSPAGGANQGDRHQTDTDIFNKLKCGYVTGMVLLTIVVSLTIPVIYCDNSN